MGVQYFYLRARGMGCGGGCIKTVCKTILVAGSPPLWTPPRKTMCLLAVFAATSPEMTRKGWTSLYAAIRSRRGQLSTRSRLLSFCCSFFVDRDIPMSKRNKCDDTFIQSIRTERELRRPQTQREI